nr:LAGLIDADG endonuclease [Cordyceps militaris]
MYGAHIIFNKTKIFQRYYSNKNQSLKPYWITGFADGESSFSIRTTVDNSRKINIRVLPIFSIELHKKDVEVLQKIKEFFGAGSIIFRTRDGVTTVIYSVQDYDSLVSKIIPHFVNYPLITQKQRDFLFFKEIVELMSKKEHLTKEGLLKILSLKNSMGKGLNTSIKKLYPNITKLSIPSITTNQSIKSVWWLIGFVDAEGCFYIKIAKSNQISLVFSLSQHNRDIKLFYIIKDYIKCGIIEQPKTREDVRLVVYNLNNLTQNIIPILDNNLITQKRYEFNKFKNVSLLMLNKEHLTEEGRKTIIEEKNK